MAKEDYQWSESRGVLYAISQNPAFSESIRKRAESAIKFIDKKIDAQILKQVKDSFDEFYEKFAPSLDSIIAKARQKFGLTLGNALRQLGFLLQIML